MKRALVLLCQGCEETEAVAVIDVLRRAGIEVVAAGVDADPIVASRGVRLLADKPFDAVAHERFDVVYLPGGRGGTDRLMTDPRVQALLRRRGEEGGLIAAICAAPEALQEAGLLEGRRVTSHPSVRDRLRDVAYDEARVVRDGAFLTSRGPGTAIELGYAIVDALLGAEVVARVEAGVLAER